MKNLKVKILFALFLVFSTWVFARNYGPIDTFPRVMQTSISPDKLWKIEIIKRKSSFLPMSKTIVTIRITDFKDQRVSEKRIYKTGVWNAVSKKYDIKFSPKLIILNDFWVIEKDTLDLNMCPLLKCLEEDKLID